jgi:hypothetical protein
LSDVETFEVDPHGMSRIGDFAVSKCVGSKQIAKLVVQGGLGSAKNRNECDANGDDAETDDQNCEPAPPRQASERMLNRKKRRRLAADGGISRGEKDQYPGGHHKEKFEKRQKQRATRA